VKVDSALILRSVGALVGLAGVIGIPLWAGTDTLEAKVAFWTVWFAFVLLVAYSASPLLAGPIRAAQKRRENWKRWEDAGRDFPAWKKRWDNLDSLIRGAVREQAASGRPSESTASRYAELRQQFQANRPSFVSDLNYAVEDRLMHTVARMDRHRFNLDLYIAQSSQPLRLFYSETDLTKLVEGICPSLGDSWYGRQHDIETLNRTLDRIQDIIREFAAEQSLPYDLTEQVHSALTAA